MWMEKHKQNNFDYAEKSPFAVFGFRPLGAPKNLSKKLIENLSQVMSVLSTFS